MIELKTEKEFKEEFSKAKNLVKFGRIASGRLNRLLQFLPHGEEKREEIIRKYNVLHMTDDITYSYESYVEELDAKKNRMIRKKVKTYVTVENVPQVPIHDIVSWMSLAKQSVLTEMRNR